MLANVSDPVSLKHHIADKVDPLAGVYNPSACYDQGPGQCLLPFEA
jgi:hypothetical protein